MIIEQSNISAQSEMELLSNCSLCNGNIRTIDEEFCLAECEKCGYVFDNPRPNLNAVVRFYSKPQQYDSWLSQQRSRQRLWKRRMAKFVKVCSRGSLLDVGAGIGQFLEHAKRHFTEVAGTEISETAVKIAREKYGLNVLRGQIDDLDLPTSSFDNITLFHVLEHVPYPKKTVLRCFELLRPNGILLICVPNEVLAWTSRIKRFGKVLGFRAFQKFSPTFGISRAGTSREIHLSRFTPPVLRNLLERCDFEVLEEGLDPYFVGSGARELAHRLYYGLHQCIWKLFGVNRYDTIWMVARKIQARGSTEHLQLSKAQSANTSYGESIHQDVNL